MTPTSGITTSSDTHPRIRRRMDEVLRHARRTFHHSVTAGPPPPSFDLDESLPGATPWTVEPRDRSRPLWSPASWFSTLAVAGAVPLAIVYWMLH